jgi:rubrerythrin
MYPDYNMYNQFYGFNNDYNYRSCSPVYNNNDEIITLNQAIELIKKSVGDEKEDEMFYDNLIKQAPTEKEKEIIISIRDDERKHNNILRELYYNFTGQMIPPDTLTGNIDDQLNYKEQLEKALFGELNAVVKYRRIMGTMPSGNSYTLLMSIMTDELRHASKYNFLIHNAK